MSKFYDFEIMQELADSLLNATEDNIPRNALQYLSAFKGPLESASNDAKVQIHDLTKEESLFEDAQMQIHDWTKVKVSLFRQ